MSVWISECVCWCTYVGCGCVSVFTTFYFINVLVSKNQLFFLPWFENTLYSVWTLFALSSSHFSWHAVCHNTSLVLLSVSSLGGTRFLLCAICILALIQPDLSAATVKFLLWTYRAFFDFVIITLTILNSDGNFNFNFCKAPAPWLRAQFLIINHP